MEIMSIFFNEAKMYTLLFCLSVWLMWTERVLRAPVRKCVRVGDTKGMQQRQATQGS